MFVELLIVICLEFKSCGFPHGSFEDGGGASGLAPPLLSPVPEVEVESFGQLSQSLQSV